MRAHVYHIGPGDLCLVHRGEPDIKGPYQRLGIPCERYDIPKNDFRFMQRWHLVTWQEVVAAGDAPRGESYYRWNEVRHLFLPPETLPWEDLWF